MAFVVTFLAVAASHRWRPFGKETGSWSQRSTLAGATRDLVYAALDQSEIVSPVPDGQMWIALERAGKPRNTRVDATQPLIDLATPSFEPSRSRART